MKTNHPGRPKRNDTRDLRSELLNISKAILEEGGLAALSLREVARQAKCTHQAPYHYFADRETLLATLVTQGFEELAAALACANQVVLERGHREGLIASGRAYVDFALAQPGIFRIMFRADICNSAKFPALKQAGTKARAELEKLITVVLGNSFHTTMSTLVWSHVHGLAWLMIDGPMSEALHNKELREAHLSQVEVLFADMVLLAAQSQS